MSLCPGAECWVSRYWEVTCSQTSWGKWMGATDVRKAGAGNWRYSIKDGGSVGLMDFWDFRRGSGGEGECLELRGPCLLSLSIWECAKFCDGVTSGCWRNLTPSTLTLGATTKVPFGLRERAGTGRGWLMGIVEVVLGTDFHRAISLFFGPHVIP